ncbi:hypothetical protein AB3N36_23100 (plasmid) [Enterobacter asburiae]|nr:MULTISPECIES: hypothetical protein [unclassified Enterobacter]
MSQLSFASFFDQAREAAPLTPAKPVLPTVNAQPIPHRMMTIDQTRRQRAGYGADKNAGEY